jgi:2-oxoglutarate dehydrogenase E1 component
MIEAPVLHVNGDDPEAVVLATQLALEYRQQFKKDVVVDIICFRKLGHNEQDTPMLTQPLMYKKIAQHPGTRKLYADKLVARKACCGRRATTWSRPTAPPWTPAAHRRPGADQLQEQVRGRLDALPGKKWTDAADTAVPLAEWKRLAERITTCPKDFKVHPLVEEGLSTTAPPWAAARSTSTGAWASTWPLPRWWPAGYPVRLSGEDCGRGTFTHRHAVLHDQNREKWDEGTYVPLQNVADNQAPFTVIDSILSEEAVLGFEYGYAQPTSPTRW